MPPTRSQPLWNAIRHIAPAILLCRGLPCRQLQPCQSLSDCNRMLQVNANVNAQVAAVIIGIDAAVGITAVAFVADNGSGIGDAIMHSIDIHRPPVPGAEEHSNNPCVGEVRDMTENVLGTIILIMALSIIHGIEILITHRHLPHDCTTPRLLAEFPYKVEIAGEIGEGEVITIPPRTTTRLSGIVVGYIVRE